MSIQQRLLQREPLDPWSIREQLCLASAVCRSGDQNWMSVSRALRAAGDPSRPQDWYQQKYCAAQYGALLESAETPKRKKRHSEGAGETPQEAILKRFTAARIAELQKLMHEHKTQYAAIKEEVDEIRNPATSDARIRDMLTAMEGARRAREREQQRQAQWLRDREQRRRSGDKSRRISLTPAAAGMSPPASSPLLSSLLNNTSPVEAPSVTRMLHIPHPSHIPDTTSPSASAPTLSQLLEKGRAPAPPKPPASDAAVIEQIKSELQEIENNLRLGTIPPSTPSVLAATLTLGAPAPEKTLDIDDIEIKAEDVYAFRDMDFEMQPVSSMHKVPVPRGSADKATREDGETAQIIEVETVAMPPEDVEIKQELIDTAATSEEAPVPEAVLESVELDEVIAEEPSPEPPQEPEVPEFNETIAHEETQETTDGVVEAGAEVETATEQAVSEEIVDAPVCESSRIDDDEDEEVNVTTLSDAPEETIDSIQQHIDSHDDTAETHHETPEVSTLSTSVLESQLEDKVDTENETQPLPVEEEVEEKQEDIKDSAASVVEADSKQCDTEETHTETDDDTPMQLIREEEKVGRKRRDYSRRKIQILSESRAASGSESAAESAPASPHPHPHTPDPDKEHRLWKKSVMLVYNRLCAHKYASLFLRPITDDVAPDYSLVVKRPMDLTSIKRNIDSGVIRTTAEFQRDVLLMLSNALFYNSSRHRVHQMAQEMHHEASAQLGMLLQAQARAALADAPEPPARRAHALKRQRLSSSTTPPAKRLRDE